MSTLTLASASGPKMAAATPGRSGTRDQRDLGLVAAVGDAADQFLFHDLVLVDDQVPGLSSKLDSTCRRTRCFMASSTERVCSTLAPSEAISSISS